MPVETFDPALIPRRLTDDGRARQWRSLRELAEDPDFQAVVEAEFPALASPQLDRRRFLQLMGASLALGGLTACGPTPETAVPYVRQPEMIVPGQARWYATAVPFAGYAQPVLGRTHVGRPTKLEGNAAHPASGGACDAFTQAAIIRLYDPDRAETPRFKGRESTWEAFQRALVEPRARLDAAGGRGLHVLLGASSSPTLRRQLEEVQRRWPQARFYRFEPFEGQRYAGAQRAFGRPLEIRPRLEHAELVVSLDDDFLGAGPLQTPLARAWGQRRLAAARGDGESRLVVLESGYSLTGAKATERRPVAPSALRGYVRALAVALGEADGDSGLADADRRWAEALAATLQRYAGRCLLSAGPYTPVDLQAAVHRLNQRLGNVGRTLEYSAPVQLLELGGQPLADLATLRDALAADEVQTLLILDANPAYAAPADLGLRDALERVPLVISASLYRDETAARSHWHLPLCDGLDGWSDARAADGRVSVLQPLAQPFYSARSLHEIVALFAGALTPDGLGEVRKTWSALDDAAWRRALERGVLDDTALPPLPAEAAPLRLETPPAVEGLEVLFRPDPNVWDGRFANLAWLQELPKPISKLTWDNVVALSPMLAAREGLANGDRVRVQLGGREVAGPVWIEPGQADGVVILYAGYGRERIGQIGQGIGYDLAPLRSATEPFSRSGARLQPTGERSTLATTQLQHALSGKEQVRQLPRAESRGPEPQRPEQPSLYPPVPERQTSWGMLIDLDQCIGCNACVVACQAENNIAVVGKQQVEKGRAMHWLRVDHYYEGEPAAPRSHFLPVPCMHCDQAPCEMGCPVNATLHGADGLNEMVYNRCIGTRTCSSFCPYKVRRFNWYAWTAEDPPPIQAQRNPNVTVRARGVMEKCTYCVQRISEARIAAKQAGREIADGEVKTACQQTCPTQAITFGNLADPTSAVRRARDSVRHYRLLEELNTRPKTTYLASIRDPGIEEDG